MNTKKRQMADRFWEKVDKNGPVPDHCPDLGQCWIWTGALNEHGYGDFFVRTGFHDKAHRVSWQLDGRVLNPELDVLHHCDNPACIRPTHLFQGTAKDNVEDMMDKGRGRNKVFKGEANGWASLTWEEVRNIRGLFKSGLTNKSEIARRCGTSRVNVNRIIANKAWVE